LSEEREDLKSDKPNEPDADIPNVDIRDLKRFALEKLSSRPILKEIILSEKDSLGSMEFLVKMQIWQDLLRAESRS